MAYNYEYPYVDPGVYNDDWLIHSMKKLIEDWTKFNTDVVDKWDEFLINAKEQYDTFTAEIRQIQSNFEREFNIRWSNYQTTMSTQWQEFQSSVNRQQTEFESRMTLRYEEFTSNLTQEMDTYRDNINKRVTDFEIDVNKDIEDMLREIADFKTYVNNYLDNLDIAQEVSNKIDNMVDNGTFASSVRPEVVTAASDWLTQHITNPSNPPLDKSLQTSSAAAESAYTGHRIFPLLSNCGLYISTEDFTLKEKAISSVDGTIITGRYNSTTELFPYQAEQGQYIYAVISPVVSSAVASIAFYTYENKFISSYRYSNPNYDLQLLKIPVPNGTSYVRACVYVGSENDIFCCIVGELDPLMANFALRSRFYSATSEQLVAVDTSNGMIQSTTDMRSTMWLDIHGEPIGQIDFDYILQVSTGNTNEWRISFILFNLERMYLRMTYNNLALINSAGDVVSQEVLAEETACGKHHFTMCYNASLACLYIDGDMVTAFTIKNIRQIGYYIVKSNSLLTNIKYKPVKIHKPKLYVILYTCDWISNPITLFEQCKTLHNTYGVDVVLAVTGHDGDVNLSNLDDSARSTLRVWSGWLKLTVFRYSTVSSVAVKSQISSVKNDIITTLTPNCYDPYLMLLDGNITNENAIELYNRHVSLGYVSISPDIQPNLGYGLTQFERTILLNGWEYKDFKTGLKYYMSCGDVISDNHRVETRQRIYTAATIGVLDNMILSVPINSGTTIPSQQVTFLQDVLELYHNMVRG